MWSTRYLCQIFIKIKFPRQIFDKSSNIEFNEQPSSGVAEFFRADRWTDRRDGANSRVSQFRQHADKLQSFSPKLTMCMLETSHNFHIVSQSSTCNFKCESKVSNTYGPKQPVAGSTLTPPPTAASRIRGMSAGACYIGNLPSLPRDHISSTAYSNGGSSSKLLQLFSSKPVNLDSFSHFCSCFSVE
jgi:hypothetical protein